MVELRDYQEKLIDDTRRQFREGKKSVVMVSPTGSGKGIILPWIAMNLIMNAQPTLIMVHRKRLVKQLCKALNSLNICYDVVKKGRKNKYLCQIGMVKTVRNCKEKLPNYKYILTDEGHRATAPEYIDIYEFFKDAKRIFLTATPARTDGQGLDVIADSIVIGPTVKWLIEKGWLASYRYFEPPSQIDWSKVKIAADGECDEAQEAEATEDSAIIGDAAKQYRKHLNGKRSIVFCRRVSGAKKTADQFNDEGIPSEHIHGGMPEAEQEAILKRFEEGETLCLMTADLLSEGVDVPECQGVIFLRRTMSVILFLQAIGRALRPKADKSSAIILDCVGNINRHGLPCDSREWTLQGVSKGKNEVSIMTCDRCSRSFHRHEAKQVALDECGDVECPMKSARAEPRKEKQEVVIDADLVEVNNPYAWAGGIDIALAKGAEYEALIAKADTEDKLKQIERIRGCKKGWRRHIMVSRGMKPPSKPNKFSRGRA